MVTEPAPTQANGEPAPRKTATGRYCVVIPALDAEKTIGAVVRGLKPYGVGILVIDDGSRDRTAAIASNAGALVISHLTNRGKGCALRTGFEHALRTGYDGVITLDADGQHDPAEIPRFIREGELQHAGLVLGDRMGHLDPMPPIRRWTNRLMSAVVSVVARQPIPDSQCGYRLIRKELLAHLPLRSQRFEIETEIIFGAAAKRWKIISLPIQSHYQQDHRSHIRPARETLRFVALVARYLGRVPRRR